ncbi:MAG: CC_3452 family protein [Croceibacterium sp.]
MLRPLTSALFLATLAAAPVAARDSGPYYRAELAQPAATSQVIAGGVLWMCEGTQCFAGKGTSRPAVICKRLAEGTSAVVSFSYGGEALKADDLARCNG